MRKGPPPSAFDRALRLVAVRDRAEGELRQRLRRDAYAESEIDAAVERLRRLGYLDDARFARSRAESLLARGRLGPRAVAQRLSAAGVARDTVRDAVDSAMSERDEVALALEAVRKRHPEAVGTKDPKLRARAARFLIGRGFGAGVVSRVLGGEPFDEE